MIRPHSRTAAQRVAVCSFVLVIVKAAFCSFWPVFPSAVQKIHLNSNHL